MATGTDTDSATSVTTTPPMVEPMTGIRSSRAMSRPSSTG